MFISGRYQKYYLIRAFFVTLNLFVTNALHSEEQHFDIWEYQVKGNSLLEAADIESAVYPYLGINKTLKTVEQARDNLQYIYKSHGYPIVVVTIPQQNVIGGIVRLDVVEGIIDRLKISGNKYFSRRDLRKEVPSMEKGKSLNMHQVRKEIDIVNKSNPYRSVVPVIRPGRHKGTIEMELKVQDRLPLYASLELNNRYTADTSKLRLMASAGYNNLWQKHHSVNLSYQMSPQEIEEVAVFNITYALPTSETSRLVMYAVKSDSEVATVTGGGDDLTVLGKGKIYGIRSINPLKTVNHYYHSFLLGLDYKDFGEDQQISNSEDTTNLNVPIAYAAWSVSYNGTYRQPSVTTQFSLTSNMGLRGVNDPEEFEFKRYLAKANYFYFNGNFGQNWNLSENIMLRYDLRGQYTESPLISNEQFSAGGLETVRGYIESSVLGDNALLGKIELNYALLGGKARQYLQHMTFTGFIDGANLRILNGLPNAQGVVESRDKLMGAGVGVTLRAFKNMDLRVFYAKPLKDLNDENYDNGGKVNFSLFYQFN